jgi:hypothetical protein
MEQEYKQLSQERKDFIRNLDSEIMDCVFVENNKYNCKEKLINLFLKKSSPYFKCMKTIKNVSPKYHNDCMSLTKNFWWNYALLHKRYGPSQYNEKHISIINNYKKFVNRVKPLDDLKDYIEEGYAVYNRNFY